MKQAMQWLALGCALMGASCLSPMSAQDIRGYSVRLEPVMPTTGIWWGELRLNVDADFELDRPFVREFSGADTLWLVNRIPLPPDGRLILKTYSGLMVQDLWPGIVDASFMMGQRTPDITNIPNSGATSVFGSSMVVASAFSPAANLPILFNHQNTVMESQGVYTWVPNIWDPDGDSLAIELESCAEGHWLPPNTQIDPHTGTITTVPDVPGLYAFCATITKFRRWSGGGPLFISGRSRYEITFDVTTVVGVNGDSNGAGIRLGPNPASNRLFVSSDHAAIRRYRMTLADGRLLAEATPYAQHFMVDCGAFPRGLYLITFESEAGTNAMKVVLE